VLRQTPSTERTLIRTIAGASRKLDEDLNLSPLQTIDRVQKLNTQFQEYWVGHPWLVLEDCYTLPAHMPVAKMLEEINRHGVPVGIVGIALLTKKRYSVFRMMFRKDEKSRKTVERSADAADAMVSEHIRDLKNLHEATNNEPNRK
jgi:hypothetical protein